MRWKVSKRVGPPTSGGGGGTGDDGTPPTPGAWPACTQTLTGTGSGASWNISTPANLQAAINGSSDGHVICLDNGTATWSTGFTNLVGGVTVKGIMIRATNMPTVTDVGAGTRNVLIKDASGPNGAQWCEFREHPTKWVTIAGIKFQADETAQTWHDTGTPMFYLNSNSGAGKPIRLLYNEYDWNVLNPNNYQGTMHRITTSHFLVSKCYMQGYPTGGPNFCGANSAFLRQKWGDNTNWQTDHSFGMVDSAGETNGYFEDCYANTCGEWIDPDDNSRIVIRGCEIWDTAVSSHGADTSSNGIRHLEFYDNKWRHSNASRPQCGEEFNAQGLIAFRGGTGLIWNNDIEQIYNPYWISAPPHLGHPVKMTMESLNRHTLGWFSCLEFSSPRNPLVHQPGWGWKSALAPHTHRTDGGANDWTQDLEPIYMWKQYSTGSPVADMTPQREGWDSLTEASCYPVFLPYFRNVIDDGSGNNWMLENREWYDEQSGGCNCSGTCTTGIAGNCTTATAPTSCTAGTAYWNTDNNTLYICGSSNNWNAFYTPYTYPHPAADPGCSFCGF